MTLVTKVSHKSIFLLSLIEQWVQLFFTSTDHAQRNLKEIDNVLSLTFEEFLVHVVLIILRKYWFENASIIGYYEVDFHVGKLLLKMGGMLSEVPLDLQIMLVQRMLKDHLGLIALIHNNFSEKELRLLHNSARQTFHLVGFALRNPRFTYSV